MPLSHDPPEFLLHKAGQRTEREKEGERSGKDRNRTSGRGATSRMGRIYTAATMVNGRTKGKGTTANVAVMATWNCCRKSGKKIHKREGGIILIILLHLEPDRSTPFSLLGPTPLPIGKHVSAVTPSVRKRQADFSAGCFVRTMRRHNSICVQIRRGGRGGRR